ALNALQSDPSTPIVKKPRNATIQLLNDDVNDIDDNTQNSLYEITESPSRSPLNESFTNNLENLSVGTENASNEENKTMKSILETTKQVLMQNISIIEKQKALEGMITQLANDIKTLRSTHENFKSNMGDRGHEWWQIYVAHSKLYDNS
ncbi:14700_t:CDS:2, partial [Cetraspora pellucida]